MQVIEKIASLFGAVPNRLSSGESFRSAEWQFAFTDWRLPISAELVATLGCIPKRDQVLLIAAVDGGSSITLNTRLTPDASSFIQELETYRQVGETSLTLDIRITKNTENDFLSIYSLKEMEDGFTRLHTRQLFAVFESVCAGENGTNCELLNSGDAEFETDRLACRRTAKIFPKINRTETITTRKLFAHAEGNQRISLPEDFHLVKLSSRPNLNSVFNRLCLVTTLSFLSDVSSLSDDGKFNFKLNGYRSITGELESQISSPALVEELFKVYRWAYSDGNTSDKLGLARNIISIHWKGDVTSPPDDGIYESILSGYRIYLKEHVDRYIDLKKSLCNYLSEFSQKSAKLADSVGDKLEKNLVAFGGFFISTILLRLVTTKDLGGLFPKPVRVIAWALIAASLLHGIMGLWFSIRERKRVIADFNLLRIRYSDLLDKADLDRALGGDDGLKAATGHLDFKLRLYFSGWLIMLILCAVTVTWLSSIMPADAPDGSDGRLTNAIPTSMREVNSVPETDSSSSIKLDHQ